MHGQKIAKQSDQKNTSIFTQRHAAAGQNTARA